MKQAILDAMILNPKHQKITVHTVVRSLALDVSVTAIFLAAPHIPILWKVLTFTLL